MGWYDAYRQLVQCGTSESDIIADEIQDIVNDTFDSSLNYEDVTIESVPREVQIFTKTSITQTPESNVMLSRPNETFNVGDIVIRGGSAKWLVTNKHYIEKIQTRGLITRCNISFKVKTGETTVTTGTDPTTGRPITTVTPIYYETPAVLVDKTTSVSDSDLGNAINLPQGYIRVECKYNSSYAIVEGLKFYIYGLNYVITGVDKSNIYDNVGTLRILAKEVVA